MLRAYFIQMVGAGTIADPLRPSGLGGVSYAGHGLPSSGRGFVIADVTPAQHGTLVADAANVTYIPIEDAGGSVVPPSGTFGDVSAANRATCKAVLEAQHVPTQGFTLADLVRTALKWAKRRMLLRQWLGVDDWTEALDSLISDMAPARRQTIKAKLDAAGFDTTVIQLTDTLREAIRKLFIQDIRADRTGDE